MRIAGFFRSMLFALVMVSISAAASAQLAVVITVAPPPLPIYEQPLCPAEGYLWVPGYWAYDYDFDDYFWVPGTWVLAPEVGLLWTPGYWAWVGNAFVFYDGYWGPRVGFYGGVVYGFGYFGEGYQGGRWDNGQFYYNRAVTNVNITNIHNVYNTTVVKNPTTVNRVSYNGGKGGITARPTPEQEAAAQERRTGPLAVQTQHVQAARANPRLRASANQGKPPVAATPKPGAFNDRAVVSAKAAGAPYKPAANRVTVQPSANTVAPSPESSVPPPGPRVHPNDPPHPARREPRITGDARLDEKYRRQQEKLQAKQDQQRQKLQERQDKEHQRMERQMADEARRQQMEQKHQQQTQQLEQKHFREAQRLEERQQPRGRNREMRPPEEKQ